MEQHGSASTADLASTKQNSMSGSEQHLLDLQSGTGSPAISTTEEWNFSTTTITSAAWSSSGNLLKL